MWVRHLVLPRDGGFMPGGAWKAYYNYDALEERIVVEDDVVCMNGFARPQRLA